MTTIYPKRISFTASDGNTYYKDFPNNGVTDSTTTTIGEPGTAGFGVGVFPGTEEQLTALGLTAAEDNDNPYSENYGLYLHADGNVRFIPKFYYKVGYTDDDADDVFYSKSEFRRTQGATHGNNALAIVGSETFSSEAEANEAGYVLHRAFIDGGEEKDGFFIDEFIASRGTDGTSTTAKSVANGKIISLTTNTSYTNSNGMTDECTGIFADAITLAKTRGDAWSCASVFMYSALAMLSLCHGEFSDSDTYCAWYDAEGTTNFPKGCNSSLSDYNDSTIEYTTCGDSGNSNKPLTGSCNYPAKVAHNGQLCGVKDLNGCVHKLATGAHSYLATSYLFNESSKLSDFTRTLATSYDVSLFHVAEWSSGQYWGNTDNGSLYSEASGDERALCGCYATANGYSYYGTNLFGNDINIFRSNSSLRLLCPVGGSWDSSSGAGVFCRIGHDGTGQGWNYASHNFGFYCAAYAS